MVKKYLALGLALCVVSCSEKKIAEAPELQLVGVTDTGATALAFDSEGKLVDAVEIQPGADIEWIEFRAPQNGEEIYVEIVGSNQSEVLRSRKAVVSSKVANGYLGAVIVEVKDGTVVGVRGNKITSGSKLSPGMLEEAKSILDDPQRNRPESTVIVQRNKYEKGLINDGKGNLIPNDITPEQQKFLNDVIGDLEKSDMMSLRKYIHPKPKGAKSYRDTEAYLKRVSKDKILRYQFIRYDAEYHRHLSRKNSWDAGTKMQSSLPVEWELKLYFSPKRADIQYSADLKIGSDHGVLKFPTEYSK